MKTRIIRNREYLNLARVDFRRECKDVIRLEKNPNYFLRKIAKNKG